MKTPFSVWKHDFGRIILSSILGGLFGLLGWWGGLLYFAFNLGSEAREIANNQYISTDNFFDATVGLYGLPVSLAISNHLLAGFVSLIVLILLTALSWSYRTPRINSSGVVVYESNILHIFEAPKWWM